MSLLRRAAGPVFQSARFLDTVIDFTMELHTFKTDWGTITYWVSYAPAENLSADIACTTLHPMPPKHALANNDPWLVFLPGLAADHRLFNQQMAYFADRANCLVWDAPGQGKSRPFEQDHSLSDEAEMLWDLFEQVGVVSPVLIGQGYGGFLAQQFIINHPGVAQGFASIDSAPLQRPYYSAREIKSLRRGNLKLQSMPWSSTIKSFAKRNATTVQGQGLIRRMLSSYTRKEFHELSRHKQANLADALEVNVLFAIDCPILLIWGDHDQEAIAKQFSQKRTFKTKLSFVEIPHAGRLSVADWPAEINKHLEIFVQGLERQQFRESLDSMLDWPQW